MLLADEIEMRGKMAVAVNLLEACEDFAFLIPEVRSNLVFALPSSETQDEVLGVEGRITVIDGRPHASGRPQFGASSHMARLIIELRKTDSSLRAAVNFANNPALARWLEEYCRSKGWVFSKIDRQNEPEDIRGEEGASMPWKVQAAIEAAGGRVPKIFYETGAIGKEPVSVLVGKDPIEVAGEVCEIARRYHVQLEDR